MHNKTKYLLETMDLHKFFNKYIDNGRDNSKAVRSEIIEKFNEQLET